MKNNTMKFNYDFHVRMDFSKSMNNPNSRTMRILRYLHFRASTKDELVYRALERKTPYRRGYAGVYFGMLRKAGLVNLTRYGREYVYTITELGTQFLSKSAPTVESARPTYVKWTYPNGPLGGAVAVEVKGPGRGESVNGIQIEYDKAR